MEPAPRPVASWLAVWVLVLLVVNLAWVRAHVLPHPPPWDQATYLHQALRMTRALADDGPAGLVGEVVGGEDYVAPLFALSLVPLHTLVGDGRLVAHLGMSLYLLPLLAGTFLLGRRLAGTPAGLLAAFLLSTSSMVIVLSRDLMMDLPAAAWMPLALDRLWASGGFLRRRPSLGFGVLAGLTLLSKTMTGIFLVAPAAAALHWGRKSGSRLPLRHALEAAAVAAALASIWWAPHLGDVVWYLWHFGVAEGAAPYDPTGGRLLSLENALYYALALANHGVSPPLAAACMGLAAARLLARAPDPAIDRFGSRLLWAWLGGGYLVLTLARNKAEDRYPVVLLPALAVLAASWVFRTRSPAWRRGLVAAFGALGLLNYLALTLSSRHVPWILRAHYRPSLGLVAAPDTESRWWRSPHPVPPPGPWPHEAVLDRLEAWWRGAWPADLEERALHAPWNGGAEEEIARLFRLILRRDPDAVSLREYSGPLARARLTRAALVRDLMRSPEFRTRPPRVLMEADHPFMNAGTLGYLAERRGRPVAFVSALDLTRSRDLGTYDAVVVRSGGPAEWRRLSTSDPETRGFRRLPEAFGAPDGSTVQLWVAEVHGGGN